jgi:hypothetical protein
MWMHQGHGTRGKENSEVESESAQYLLRLITVKKLLLGALVASFPGQGRNPNTFGVKKSRCAKC